VIRRSAALRLLGLLAPAACSTPTPQIAIDPAGPPVQSCPSTDCSMVALPCDAVMSIRIVDPESGQIFLDQCSPVPPDIKNDMCSLRSVNLDARQLPVQDLAVEVAVFPQAMLDVPAGGPVCPSNIQYDAAGFPISQPAPTFGRRAYYHPGDELVKIELGCTDFNPATVGATCGTPAANRISATVTDFKTRVPVGSTIAMNLVVSVVEPVALGTSFAVNERDAVTLSPDDDDLTWSAPLTREFNNFECVEVFEAVPQSTPTLHCTDVHGVTSPLSGVRIAVGDLPQIVGGEVPAGGITVGVVVDEQSNPVQDFTITPTTGTVSYPPAANSADDVSRTSTSMTGLFVSRDAPFGTQFFARGQPTASAIGGLVAGKVTVVVVPVSSAALKSGITPPAP
jgi:hypothetical protein